MKEIDPKHKCSRCKNDLRKKADKGGCLCYTEHHQLPSKSGGQTQRTIMEYQGRQTKC